MTPAPSEPAPDLDPDLEPDLDLVLDLGNSRLHAAFIADGELQERLDRPLGPTAEELIGSLPERRIRAAALVSVVPALEAPLAEAVQARYGRPLRRLGVELPSGVDDRTRTPASVGPDRLMLARWAGASFPGRRVLVCGIGTAITTNIIDRDGAFLGGAIAPGLPTAARGLAVRAARLPEVTVKERPSALGRSTEEALAAGVYYSCVGGLERLIAESRESHGVELVIATGGDLELVGSAVHGIDHREPDLVLRGLAIALSAALAAEAEVDP